MHRTHLGGLLGVALVPACAVDWRLGLACAGGLVWTRSLTGAGAGLVGLVVWRPTLALPAAVAAAVAVWCRARFRPGGKLADSARARLLSWIYLAQHLRWLGHGPGSARLALEAADLRSGHRAMDGPPARNEFLELVYEYGAAALLVFAALGVWVAPHLHWGDPATAMGASVLAVCSVTSPLRAFWTWLRGSRVALFDPPTRVSVSVHMDHRGDVSIYGPPAPSHQQQVDTTIALNVALRAWVAAHEIRLEEAAR